MVIIKLCKPYRSPLQAVFIIAFTVVLVLISAASAPYFPQLSLYIRLFGGACLLVGAFLVFRYTMVEFVYALSDGVLSVRRTMGVKETTVFSIELSTKTTLLLKNDFKKLKGISGGTSYRQNLTAASAFLVYERGGKKRYIEIEPNVEFYALIKAEIENQKDKDKKA